MHMKIVKGDTKK